ncbi:FMN-dependent dehydrogenase-domain-containing protein [Xylaria bambusicola]|uniref:FMN-dependent dehydrogenase-domain-containing protein n=1 Tax=Xylaria bambusicola TaxID=326684 RepID=UPI0020084CED|nr:FMN-dependent dehydrogenase-domain-containing protein [Xylaria bambusicola]KAI0517025.1 FMN-dependent dehydrogenase-domain-containing protein [Xylaria bambusicola]
MESKKNGVVLSAQEIASHRSTSSCWIVVDGKAYDVTGYLDEHPGGAAVLLKQGGTDATAEFRKIHSPDVLKYLPEDACLGAIDAAAQAALPISTVNADLTEESGTEDGANKVPHISSIVAPNDFEAAAKISMPLKSWTYVSSYSHDGSAFRGNLTSWQAVRFRPRIFADVRTVTPQCRILGSASAFPFYVSAMGQLGRGHPAAEIGLVRALARRGAHGVISTESTVKMEEIAAAFLEEKKKVKATAAAKNKPEARLHFQLYIPADREIAIQRIRRVRATGVFHSLWVTVDTAVLGKRTADRKLQAAEALAASPELAAHAERAGFGALAHAGGAQLNASLTWEDLKWMKREWGGPVVLKGVQTAEDAAHAAELGVDGVLLSNHGGRQMHDAPDALTTLLEIRTYYPGLVDRLEIFVDGGCRDGADVLKAVALGAKAVGVGRPFFYALAAYGEKGVERCLDIFADELVTGMRLVGIKDLDEAQPERVNASRLLNEIWRPEKSRL